MKRSLLRTLSALLALWMLGALLLPVCAADEEEGIPAEPKVMRADAAYLYNFENNQVLYELNADAKVYPASTVKLMTAIVAFEHYAGALDTEIVVTQEMVDDAVGNTVDFAAGEVITAEQALSCMLVNSANDAALVLAYAVAGDVPTFVQMMNAKADELGAVSTYYTNPTGMHDPDMVTTARDTAVISRYAYTVPGLIEMTSSPKYVMEATNYNDFRNVYNRNCLISKYYSTDYYYPRALGLNAGATSQGGYAISAVAEDPESGLSYLAVVLGADASNDDLYNYINAVSMLDWAFEAYSYAKVLSKRKTVCEIPVNLSSTIDYVTLVPEEDISVYLPTTVDLETEVRYSYNTYMDALDAPVEAGMEAGTITVFFRDEILGSCPLVTTSSVTRSEFLHFLGQVRKFTEGRFFRGMVISAILLSILYVFLRARQREKKLRRMTGRW